MLENFCPAEKERYGDNLLGYALDQLHYSSSFLKALWLSTQGVQSLHDEYAELLYLISLIEDINQNAVDAIQESFNKAREGKKGRT